MHMPSMRACAHVRMYACDTWKTMGLERRRPASCAHAEVWIHAAPIGRSMMIASTSPASNSAPVRMCHVFLCVLYASCVMCHVDEDRVHLSHLQLSTCTLRNAAHPRVENQMHA